MKAISFQHAYSEPVRTSDLSCSDPSLTQQGFRDDCDINVLLERFKVTGQMPGSLRLPEYGDFSGITDFRGAMDAVLGAQSQFLQLPAKVRDRFQNSPQAFMEFMANPTNADEMRSLGILPAKPAVAPAPAPEPSKAQ